MAFSASEQTHQQLWVRADGELPDDPLLHAAVVAYASDMSIIDSILKPHEIAWQAGPSMVVSLDHCMWFHRPLRADSWLLIDQDSPAAFGRGGSAGPGVRRARQPRGEPRPRGPGSRPDSYLQRPESPLMLPRVRFVHCRLRRLFGSHGRTGRVRGPLRHPRGKTPAAGRARLRLKSLSSRSGDELDEPAAPGS